MSNVRPAAMSVEQVSVVDIIGTSESTDAVYLTISDHLEWNDEHLLILQEKLNTYLAFVESGEIYTSFPDARGKKLVFEIVLKYRPNATALSFLHKAAAVVEEAG